MFVKKNEIEITLIIVYEILRFFKDLIDIISQRFSRFLKIFLKGFYIFTLPKFFKNYKSSQKIMKIQKIVEI